MKLTFTGVLKDVGALQPMLVVSSPKTGNKLYVNPQTFVPGPSPRADGSLGIEFPFALSLASGLVPNDGKSTDSVAEFVTAEKWTILEARGPFGIPWWGWGLGLLTMAVAPYLVMRRNQ